MHDEDDFLRKLTESPADDTLRMIYADWLDELGGEESKKKAQFLRVTVRLMGPIQRPAWRQARRKELHELARTLPGAWLAVVSRLKVENCPEAQRKAEDVAELARQGLVFTLVCDRRWDELTATEHPAVRRCNDCGRGVYYCDTIDEARDHARHGRCVAVNLGVIRQPRDLEPPRILLGGTGLI
ncbi:MAG: TIGR02996 domain-containing protein [Planctomycetes bacterium]|nr:TIGR02996 domain-containing protein [Planctomycetota bacterium]